MSGIKVCGAIGFSVAILIEANGRRNDKHDSVPLFGIFINDFRPLILPENDSEKGIAK